MDMMKKWKKALVFVMTLGLTLGMLTVGAFAANGDVAQIGDTVYGTLGEAIAAANETEMDTIILLQNAYLSSLTSVKKDLIIDLNGHELNTTGNGKLSWDSDRTITIQNGALSGNGTVAEMRNGSLTLLNLTSSEEAAITFNISGGTAIVSGCDLMSKSYSPIFNVYGYAKMSVTGGTCLTGTSSGSSGVVGVGGNGRLTVENAEITGNGPAIRIANSSAEVLLTMGAEINTNSNNGEAVVMDGGKLMVDDGVTFGAMVYPVKNNGGEELLPPGRTLEFQDGKYVLSDCVHDFEEAVIAATCEEDGRKTLTCKKCHDEQIEIIPSLGHDFDEWTITKEPSCDEAGERTHTCQRENCGKIETEVIETAGHAWDEWTVAKPANCTEAGEETRSCTKCDATESRAIEAKGHTEVIDQAVEATCTTEGKTEGKHCSVCDTVLVAQETVPVKAHASGTEWTSDAAKHWHECEVCHAHLDEAAHTEDGGVVTTPATSTTDGVRTYTCTVCEHTRTERIPATGGGSEGPSGPVDPGPVGPSTPSGPSTGEEDLPGSDTPLTGDPEDGEDLGDSDVPLVSKPFLFEDVGENRWFYPAIKYVFDRGLMDGVNATRFDPMSNTTRGMIVTVLHRMEEKPAPESQPDTFTDLKAGQWYTDAVLWAADNGIVNGYSTGAFGPEDNVTREQLVAILYRYAQYKGYDVSVRGDLSVFGDGDKVAKYAREAMEWAVGAKLISGVTETSLEPKGNANRAQIATVLMNFDRFVAESTQAENQGE